MQPTYTVGVVSLGCSKNRVDTEQMLGILKEAGYVPVAKPEQAQILIVNTCGFIEPAKVESIDTIFEMAQYKKSGSCRLLVVTGCLSERYREELKAEMPEVDLFLGVREYEILPGKLAELLDRKEPVPTLSPACMPPRVLTTPPYSAYLRVSDGCNNRCTYCAIPLIRGRLNSVPMPQLLDEAKRLADNGVSELTVIAQDTSGYGVDLCGKSMLPTLLDELCKIDGLHWVRVLYTYPDTVTKELIQTFIDHEKIANYLDIPLQHICDPVLQRMNRRGSRKHIQDVLDYIRTYAPDFMLRTTMMVGFPGETDEDFSQLLAFLRDYPFDRVGAFAFSPEEGTAAALMPDQVPEEVKQARLDALMRQQQEISLKRNQARVGQEVEVLIEGMQNGVTHARSYAEAPEVDGKILLPHQEDHTPGQYIKARLTKAMQYDMWGETL